MFHGLLKDKHEGEESRGKFKKKVESEKRETDSLPSSTNTTVSRKPTFLYSEYPWSKKLASLE
jgi:hypothetical protein